MSATSENPSTLTMRPESGEKDAGERLVLRWVYPLPTLTPTWLTQSLVTFGRDPTCSVPLDGQYVSRHHARITRSGALWILSDLGSKNGLSVNGRVVSEHVLSPGDVVRMGNHVGVCMLAPPSASLACAMLEPGIYGGLRLRGAVRRMREMARTDLVVVLEGETGTGKETFARALHAASGRTGPFLAVNCSVYSKAMAAAELFGYRKGAFTGAQHASVGHIRAAQEGTLLLDELTELSADVQAMLLRVLENHEVLPLGESRCIPIDVRFVAAAQTPLDVAVEAGILRADLRARLEGCVVRLPPLRASREVVLDTFLEVFELHSGQRPEVAPAFAEGLCLHPWPLNLRELDTFARRLSATHRPGTVLDQRALDIAQDTPDRERAAASRASEKLRRQARALYTPAELSTLSSTLAAFRGNLTRAAEAMGVSRARAYRMLLAARETNGSGQRPERHVETPSLK